MAVTFSETQRYDLRGKTILFLETILILGLMAWFVSGHSPIAFPFNRTPPPALAVIIGYFAFLGFAWWLLGVLYLRVDVEERDLRIQFHPYKTRLIALDRIVRAEAVSFRPIRDCGGHGARWGYKGKGWSYVISGTQGVEIETMEGQIALIGSQRSGELAEAIRSSLVKPHQEPR